MIKKDRNSRKLGKTIHWLEVCESTNKLAYHECIHGNAEDGTIWLSDHQTQGRGQRGNSWISDPGKNLLFSFNLNLKQASLNNQFFLSKVISIGIKEGIEHFFSRESKSTESLKIKWPNDIYWGKQKIGGILIENQISGGKWKFSIIGIGININQTDFILKSATSIKNILGKEIDRQKILSDIIFFVEENLTLFEEENWKEINQTYHQNLLGIGKEIKFQETNNQTVINGVIQGVEDNGKIKIETNLGVKFYEIKEISLILSE